LSGMASGRPVRRVAAAGTIQRGLRAGLLGQCSPCPGLGHHELVALWIDAHGEMEFLLGRLVEWSGELAAELEQAIHPGAEVIELEGEPGPGAFAFAVAVEADDGVADEQLAPDLGAEGQLGIEEV